MGFSSKMTLLSSLLLSFTSHSFYHPCTPHSSAFIVLQFSLIHSAFVPQSLMPRPYPSNAANSMSNHCSPSAIFFISRILHDFFTCFQSRTRDSTPCRVGPSVRRCVRNISDLRAVNALLFLPNRPRLDCRVSGLVSFHLRYVFFPFSLFRCVLASL